MSDVVDMTGEAWDVFGPIAAPSAARTWTVFGLTIAGCVIGGCALGALLAATIFDRILHR